MLKKTLINQGDMFELIELAEYRLYGTLGYANICVQVYVRYDFKL